ncbi:MAG: EF-P 5-aminopentanol modification-associated protein YfmH [Halanaerobiales bacterium]
MEKVFNEDIKEYIYSKKLSNGLDVYMMPRDDYHRQYAIFATRFGSNDINFKISDELVKVPQGIAHFLEHKLFEGKKGDIFSKFASIGASANAFTNYNTTAYLFTSTEKFKTSLISLIDFVQEPYFAEKSVEKEKGIIAQEIKMYDDEPNYKAYTNMLSAMYQKHPVRNDIAGTVESVYSITREDLYRCYNSFYHPENMVLFMIGGFDPVDMSGIIEDNQNNKEFPEWNNVQRIFPEEPTQIKNKKIVNVMQVAKPIIRLGFKETVFPDKPLELVKQELGTEMLLDLIIGKGSKLYQTLYDSGLVDDRFHNYYILEDDYGYILMGGETKSPDELYKRIMEGIQIEIDKVLNEKDFKRVYKKYLGGYIESYNSFKTTATEYINYYFKDVNYFDIIKIMQEIDLEYLTARYNKIINEQFAVSSIIMSK